MKKLLITEKPSVANDFARVLKVNNRQNGYIENDEWIISWCIGHLVALSYPEKYDEKYKKWILKDLPILPNNWLYEPISQTISQYKVLKKLLNSNISAIYYAGDSAREGEIIQRLVRQEAGHNKNAKEYRVWLDSQTDEEIKKGISEAKELHFYDKLADSAYERAREDWLIGMNFSRGLSSKYAAIYNDVFAEKKYMAISVGRVMTCVLGMVVDREYAIRNFKPTTFYKINGKLNHEGIISEWQITDNSAYAPHQDKLYKNGFLKKADADGFVRKLKELGSLTVKDIQKKKELKKAPQLYNLAELQNDCSQRFKISPDETLKVVQKLYEAKIVTYPRTDARVLTTAISKVIDKNIKGLEKKYPIATQILSSNYRSVLSEKRYVDDSKVSDHYAIIPTGIVLNSEAESKLSTLERNIYDLICRRFLSIFLPPAEYLKCKIVFCIKTEIFESNASVLVKNGYLDLLSPPKEKDGENSQSENIDIRAIDSLQIGKTYQADFYTKEGTTQPPKRYNSGSIILAMENAGNLIEDEELRSQIKGSGIGTSATRAGIIEKLVNNKHISINKKTQIITPTSIGEALYEIVKMTIPGLLNPKLTASWEKGLSMIETGEISREEYHKKLEVYVNKEIDKIKSLDISKEIKEACLKAKKGK